MLISRAENMSFCSEWRAKLKDEDKLCTVCRSRVAKVWQKEFTISSDNLIQKVKELPHEGNVTRIIVKEVNGKVFLEIPVSARVIGAVLAHRLLALG